MTKELAKKMEAVTRREANGEFLGITLDRKRGGYVARVWDDECQTMYHVTFDRDGNRRE